MKSSHPASQRMGIMVRIDQVAHPKSLNTITNLVRIVTRTECAFPALGARHNSVVTLTKKDEKLRLRLRLLTEPKSHYSSGSQYATVSLGRF